MTVVGWTNIGELATADPTAGEGPVGIVRDAAVVAVDGRIAWIGPASEFPDVDVSHDMAGAAMLPGFVDAHMHPVFAGDRAAEFDARMTGTAYSAGGIRTTVAATRASSDEQLAANAQMKIAATGFWVAWPRRLVATEVCPSVRASSVSVAVHGSS